MSKPGSARPRPPSPPNEQATQVGGGAVRLVGNVLRLKHALSREDEKEFRDFNLERCWLPASPLNAGPISILERPQLVTAAIESVRALAYRSAQTKSGSTQHGAAWKVLLKFFEYGWLRGLYDLSDWRQSDTDALLADLGRGGWAHALKIEERSRLLFQVAEKSELRDLIGPSKTRKTIGFSLSEAFSARIGTNCHVSELAGAKRLLIAHLGLSDCTDPNAVRQKCRSEKSGMGERHLCQELRSINLLCEHLEPGMGLTFVPYPDTVKLAQRFGRPGKRTGNLAPDAVAALLKESLWWVTEVAQPMIGLLDQIYSAVAAKNFTRRQQRVRTVRKTVAASRHQERLAELLKMPISTLGLRGDDSQSSVKQTLYNLTSACFIVIAFLNARRKDEIQHRSIGLHRSSLRVVDRRLGLYECEFYIEKTYKDYVPFYVGKHTCAAIRVLEQLSDLARDFDALTRGTARASSKHRSAKLFQVPKFLGNGHGSAPQWFQFITTPVGISHELIQRALGEGSSLRVHAHMFRRAYALIFHYRYENASLLALAQQLGHWDLETALLYVTDSPHGPLDTATAASYARKSKKQAEARTNCQKEIEEEIRMVAVERVRELAQQIVDGQSDATGGFVRLVRRFHQRLGRAFDYRDMDRERKAKVLGDAFINLGHSFKPMQHANCVASASRRTQSAACYSKRLERPAPENASPDRCGRCPYSHISSGHLQTWKAEAEKLSIQARANDTISARNAAIQLRNVQRVMELMSTRVGM